MPPPTSLSARELAFFKRKAALKHLKFQPPCSCKSCFHQYKSPDLLGELFGYHGHLKPEGVKYTMCSQIQSIAQDSKFLYAAISICGDTILKKWRPNRAMREKILKSVYPHIPLLYTQLVERSMNAGRRKARDRTMERESNLLPYLTLESL